MEEDVTKRVTTRAWVMEHVSEQLGMDLAVRVANTLTAWMCTMSLLLERGLLSADGMDAMRERLLGAARSFAASPSAGKRAFGIKGIKNVEGLFMGVISM